MTIILYLLGFACLTWGCKKLLDADPDDGLLFKLEGVLLLMLGVLHSYAAYLMG